MTARVMVTGVAGLIGSHLARALLERGHEVVGVDDFSLGREANVEDIRAHPAFQFHRANVIDPRYFVYSLLNKSGSPMWDGTRVLLPPSFSWGSRVSGNSPNYAPPNIGFPSQNFLSI